MSVTLLSEPRSTPALESAETIYVTRSQLDLDLGELFFSKIQSGIAKEDRLLHPSTNDLAVSFNAAEAVIAIDSISGTPFGYVRLEPLVTERLKSLLELPANFPALFEAGTMYIDPDARYRGHGHLRKMCATILEESRDEIDNGKMLIIGTTKDVRVLKALDDGDILNFTACHHNSFPLLSAFTCVCSGDFGKGYQYGEEACQQRLPDSLNRESIGIRELPVVNGTPEIPCTMFVNSLETARAAENMLERHFGSLGSPLKSLRNTLLEFNYYKTV